MSRHHGAADGMTSLFGEGVSGVTRPPPAYFRPRLVRWGCFPAGGLTTDGVGGGGVAFGVGVAPDFAGAGVG